MPCSKLNIKILRLFIHSDKPVQCNAAEVEDGRRSQQDIQRRPDQAENLSVPPLAGGELYRSERHHNQCNKQVGKRQRHYEVVCLLLPEKRKRTSGEKRRTGELKRLEVPFTPAFYAVASYFACSCSLVALGQAACNESTLTFDVFVQFWHSPPLKVMWSMMIFYQYGPQKTSAIVLLQTFLIIRTVGEQKLKCNIVPHQHYTCNLYFLTQCYLSLLLHRAATV